MAELKTVKNNASVVDFIQALDDDVKKQDCMTLLSLFEECTGEKAAMWGTSIIGFGSYHYKSERSAQEGDWPLTGFSPRKQNLTIYIMPGFEAYQEELARLGKHKTSVSCLYIKRLSDIDLGVLRSIVTDSVAKMRARS